MNDVDDVREEIRKAYRAIVFWMIVCTTLVLLVLAFKYRLSTRIDADVISTQKLQTELAKHNEEMILDFMARTVERWDSLARDNPHIKVPQVIEPIPSPWPTPTLTPGVTPKARPE